jgi:hypothetical protein
MPRVTFPVPKDRTQIALTGRGLIAETFPLGTGQSGTAPGATGANAAAQFGAVGLRAGDVVTGVICHCVTAGSGSTLTKTGLYDSTGTFIKATADFTASLANNTFVTAALVGGAYTIPADGLYYLALLALATVTVPTFLREPLLLNLRRVVERRRPYVRGLRQPDRSERERRARERERGLLARGVLGR